MTSPGHADTFPRARRPSLQMPGASPQTGSSPRAIPSSTSSPMSASISTSPRAVPIAASPRAVPLPVPQRHGSVNRGSFGSLSEAAAFSPRQWNSHRRGSGSLSGSVSLSSSFVLEPEMTDVTDGWLDVPAADVAKEAAVVVAGDMGLEQATQILLESQDPSILVQNGSSFGLFDFADLNTVLLLVLASAAQVSVDILDERAKDVVSRLKRGIRVSVGAVCDISQKNPCHSFPPDTPLSRLLPLFASGVHRVVLSSNPPRILSDALLLAYLIRRPPTLFRKALQEINVPLHPLVSLPASSSVLDAMQVMSLNGLSALGVVTGSGEREGELSALTGVVTTADCARLVVPSEGKQALGMGLGDMCKNVQVGHPEGRDRGEERVPVHTITPSMTLLHAANLILATSSSRVFMRTPPAASPPLSPVSPADQSPIPSPPADTGSLGLPAPPSTQLSPQYVISIVDILSCLARYSQAKLDPLDPSDAQDSWEMSPDSISKRRRRASSTSAFGGFETWRWANNPTNG